MVSITEEAVAKAAEFLLSEGKNPTQSAVRTALGGGSYSTIGPFLQKWRERQQEAAELEELDMPDALADAGTELMARVWKVAMSEAQAGHEAIRKELLQAQADTEAAQQETADVAASLEADLAVRDEKIATAEANIDQLNKVIENWHTRYSELERGNYNLDRDLAAARASLQAETERAMRSEKLADDRKQDAERKDSEIASLRTRLDKATAEYGELQSQLVQATADRDHNAERLASASDLLKKAEARTEKLEGQAEALQASLDAAREELSSLKSKLTTTEADLLKSREAAKATETELKVIKDELSSSKQSTKAVS